MANIRKGFRYDDREGENEAAFLAASLLLLLVDDMTIFVVNLEMTKELFGRALERS